MIKDILEILKFKVKRCIDNGEMFQLPDLPDYVKVQSMSMSGYLFHKSFILVLPSGENIAIDYSSRDNKNYKLRKDVSVIKINCPSQNLRIEEMWDEVSEWNHDNIVI